MSTHHAPGGGYRHDGLVIRSDDDLVDGLVPFLRDGLAAGDVVVVALSAPKNALVRDALGPDADGVRFDENRDVYTRPMAVIARAHEASKELLERDGKRLRQAGEVPFGRTRDRQRRWLHLEAVVSRALAHTNMWGLCVFDERTLPEPVVRAAYRIHPFLHVAGHRAPNRRFEAPERTARDLCPPPPPRPPGPPVVLTVDTEAGIAHVRRRISGQLVRDGVERGRASELVTGLNEVVTNAVEHGGQRVHVLGWTSAGHVHFEVADSGPGFHDPLAGFCPPPERNVGGRGLWLARQVFDEVALERVQDGFRAVLSAQV